ncbi:hypothetical protein cyc_06103 [Cyclospora cayetanensis]|uniref:Uncharacterized protein n=1 Tax=Cyclospora cayetanensis TaxID=88456 RepID=A0A1D3D5M9_9EIME|nr:hypothetical protein cyc_06103 [Cyclospora cayetanensis]
MVSQGPSGPQKSLENPTHDSLGSEEPLRVLVVGDAASGKTALLQLLQQHAAELAHACIAQQDEDKGSAAATGAAMPHSLKRDGSCSSAAAAASSAPPSEELASCAPSLPALLGYRRTCGVNVVPLRCADPSGEMRLVEFWEIGGSRVWLAYDSSNEAAYRALPAWLLELCMRAGTRPSQVFFEKTHQQEQPPLYQMEGQPSQSFETDVEMQKHAFMRIYFLHHSAHVDCTPHTLATCGTLSRHPPAASSGSSFWGWRLRCGLCPVLTVATKADKGNQGTSSSPINFTRRVWKAPDCIWRDTGKLSRLFGRYCAVEQRVWQGAYSAEEKEELKQLACSLLNSADCMETSAALGLLDAKVFFAFLSSVPDRKRIRNVLAWGWLGGGETDPCCCLANHLLCSRLNALTIQQVEREMTL